MFTRAHRGRQCGPRCGPTMRRGLLMGGLAIVLTLLGACAAEDIVEDPTEGIATFRKVFDAGEDCPELFEMRNRMDPKDPAVECWRPAGIPYWRTPNSLLADSSPHPADETRVRNP